MLTPIMISRLLFKCYWMSHPLDNRKNIWAFQLLVGEKKKHNFVYIKERIWKKLQGWKEKLLSQAGREVLIKSIIQAIPTYSMSCFKLPKGLIK